MNILITGAAGYVGSHVAAALLEAGHTVVLVDNLSRSSYHNISALMDLFRGQQIPFHNSDVTDTQSLCYAFNSRKIDAVVHCAGLKSVAEAEANPVLYYQQNVGGLISLLQCMDKYGVKDLVFSSSATVYGSNPNFPFDEGTPIAPTSVYGQTKAVCEQILAAAGRSGALTPKVLRYFNPVGAHASGRLMEDTRATNLIPALIACVRERKKLSVFGSDYNTVDGTALRDYIHISDLADAHVLALSHKDTLTVNIGTGVDVSVLELVESFNSCLALVESFSDYQVEVEMCPRRPGDVEALVCNPTLARTILGFKATRYLYDACQSALVTQAIK
jgi:UDP-glucose 4-epimerase